MSDDVLEVDGSVGGGQILRSSLALSLVTQRPFAITQIRGQRSKPGLLAQHLTAVRAAKAVGAADVEAAITEAASAAGMVLRGDGRLGTLAAWIGVEGDALGSSRVAFTPHGIHPGAHHFSVGTAGSACLVFQTVLPALLAADAPSELRLEGGTHNPAAPPFDFLAASYLPLLARMGASCTAQLLRHGFFPRGGGKMVFGVQPGALGRLVLETPGPLIRRVAVATVAQLPANIAERELEVLGAALALHDEIVETPEVGGPGNVCRVELVHEDVTHVFTAFGKKGKPAEHVARGLAKDVTRFQRAQVAVDEHLADQLLLLLALGEGGRFTTTEPSDHARTHAALIEQFLERPTRFSELGRSRGRWLVEV